MKYKSYLTAGFITIIVVISAVELPPFLSKTNDKTILNIIYKENIGNIPSSYVYKMTNADKAFLFSRSIGNPSINTIHLNPEEMEINENDIIESCTAEINKLIENNIIPKTFKDLKTYSYLSFDKIMDTDFPYLNMNICSLFFDLPVDKDYILTGKVQIDIESKKIFSFIAQVIPVETNVTSYPNSTIYNEIVTEENKINLDWNDFKQIMNNSSRISETLLEYYEFEQIISVKDILTGNIDISFSYDDKKISFNLYHYNNFKTGIFTFHFLPYSEKTANVSNN